MLRNRKLIKYYNEYLPIFDSEQFRALSSIELGQGAPISDFAKFILSKEKAGVVNQNIIEFEIKDCVTDGFFGHPFAKYFDGTQARQDDYICLTPKGRKLMKSLYFFKFFLEEFKIVLVFIGGLIASPILLNILKWIWNLIT